MKKIVPATLFAAILLIAHPFVAVGQIILGVKGKATHTSLVDGLKQFPAKYPISRGYIRATVHGYGPGDPVKEYGEVFESKFLGLTTEDGQNLTILVVGSEVDLALFMHEVRPYTGKYKFWYSVLEFQGKYNDWVYSWYEIEVVGRFSMEIDKNTGVIGYQNEAYR